MERFSILLHLLVVCQAANHVKAQGGEEWGEWSSCSRTCGPAISIQERSSLNQTFTGPRKQFRSCRNEPCREPVDLRAELCSTFNDSNHTYTPLNENSQCLLTCRATGPNGEVSVHGSLQASPGTPCTTSLGTDGICVDTVCSPVGCDGILGSRKRVDKCGRCIGPGVHGEICNVTKANRTEGVHMAGHVKMLELPSGASSVSVTNHLPPHLASLVVRSQSGEFLFSVGPPGFKFVAEGAEFTYSVSVEAGNYTESLSTQGKLNDSIVIEVYIPSGRVAPTLSYEYHTLVSLGPWAQAGERTPLFTTITDIGWTYGPFLPCTNTCATGVQVAYAICKDFDFNRILPDAYCDSEKPTPILRHCGVGECAPRWVSKEWWPCSGATCGRGMQERLVQCMVLETNGRERMVVDEMCNDTAKPPEERECAVEDTTQCDVQWEVEEWGECCSDEPLERRVECVTRISNISHSHPPFLCSHLHRNSSSRVCERGPCSNGGCTWAPKRWFMCNNTCGQGVQRRNVRCRNTAGKAADTFCCRGQPLPELTRECYDDRSAWCQPDWHSGTWEQCGGACGVDSGERSRRVECQAENRQSLYVTFPEEFCPNQSRPADAEACTREDPQCVDCEWTTGPWNSCYCPVGVRLRSVECSSGNDNCCFQNFPDKPPDAEPCTCPTDTYTVGPSTTPPPTTVCVDYPDVDCRQVKEDGYCLVDDTDFFELLCCQTCSDLR